MHFLFRLQRLQAATSGLSLPWVCYLPGVRTLCQALVDVYDQIVPGVDYDGDKFRYKASHSCFNDWMCQVTNSTSSAK